MRYLAAALALFLAPACVSAQQHVDRLIPNWFYETLTDSMGRGDIKTATTVSTNELRFSSPYEGAQRAYVNLRVHPKNGKSVILVIEKGQFLCHNRAPTLFSRSDVFHCDVMVRFDDGRVRNFEAVGPSDYDSTMLFIQDQGGFTKELLKARHLRIEAQFYREGFKVMMFDVAGLKW